MDRNEVGRAKQLVEADPLAPNEASDVRRHKRIEDKYAKSKRVGLGNERARDGAKAHKSQCLAL